MNVGNATTKLTIPFGQECDFLLDSFEAKTVKAIIWCTMLAVALVGNSLVIISVYRNLELRTTINLIILNMAISDLFLPVFLFPTYIQNIYTRKGTWLIDGVFGEILCKMSPFASSTSLIVSYTCIVIIAIERFFGILFPMKRQPIANKKTCYILITLTWILGALYSSQFFYTYRLDIKDGMSYCHYSWQPAFNTKTANQIETLVYYFCFTLVPFILIVAMYSAIIVAMKRQSAHQHLGNAESVRRAREDRQVTLMLLSVTEACVLSWIPSNVYVFLMIYDWKSPSPCELRHFRYVANVSGYCFPAVNPFIYYIFNEKYKNGFKELLCCKKVAKSQLETRIKKKEVLQYKFYESYV